MEKYINIKIYHNSFNRPQPRQRYVVFPSIKINENFINSCYNNFIDTDPVFKDFEKVLRKIKVENSSGRMIYTPIDFDYYSGHKRISRSRLVKSIVSPESISYINHEFESYYKMGLYWSYSYSIQIKRKQIINEFFLKNSDEEFTFETVIFLMSIFKEELHI